MRVSSQGTSAAGAVHARPERTSSSRALFPACVATLFALLASFTAAFHEPWADEAQAWLIARDLNFWPMIAHQVRYEGSPGLWHSLLWVMSHAGLPYWSIAVVSVALGAAGAYVFAACAPFPVWIRAITPFTFYFCYQFAVVSRGYALDPLLTFAALYLIRERPNRPIWVALVLGLLANANMFGFVLSGALAAAFLLRARAELVSLGYSALIQSTALYAVFLAAALAVAYPPRNIHFVPNTQVAAIVHAEGGESALPLPDDGASDKAEADALEARSPARKVADDFEFVAHIIGRTRYGLLFIAALLWLVISRRDLGAALPPLAIFAMFRFVLAFPHHFGLMFLALIASVWLAWPERETPLNRYPAVFACAVMLTVICCEQLIWTGRAIRFDVSEAYDASRACADYLTKHFPGGRYFAYDYWTIAIAPYFNRKPFLNQPTSYWDWSYSNHVDQDLYRIKSEHPDAIVLSWRVASEKPLIRRHGATSWSVAGKERAILDAGYRPVTTLSGTQPDGRFSIETDYYRIFAPAAKPVASSPHAGIFR